MADAPAAAGWLPQGERERADIVSTSCRLWVMLYPLALDTTVRYDLAGLGLPCVHAFRQATAASPSWTFTTL
eukprot:4623560-Pyramimonas_sp.AAC.1